MWRNNRDRPDDPRTGERETQRLARDEYDRPRYGSERSDFGAHPDGHAWNSQERPRQEQAADGPGGPGSWPPGAQRRAEPPVHEQQRYQGDAPRIDEVRVHELMTRRVANVHPATSVERAARLMEECDCGALPVLGDNGVLGMVTDRDIAIRIVAGGRDSRNAIVADCMTERVIACYGNESLAECMHQMARHQVRRMPIVDDFGRLVGLVAQSDLARHIGHHPLQDERREMTEVVAAVSEPTRRPYR